MTALDSACPTGRAAAVRRSSTLRRLSAVALVLFASAAAISITNPAHAAAPGFCRPHNRPLPIHTADRVVSYEPGTTAVPGFQHPGVALGVPSEQNPFGEAVDPFNPPYGTNQIVSIGAGGHLTVRFSDVIRNHPQHPFGADFTVFGNAGFVITNDFDPATFSWIGAPATDGSLFGSSAADLRVSVSLDGRSYFLLDPARSPRIDAFPPADSEGDPAIPASPELGPDDFAGATLEDIRALYRGSAGGASFNLASALDTRGRRVRLPWIRFVRVDVLSGRVEIDAFTAVNREGHFPR